MANAVPSTSGCNVLPNYYEILGLDPWALDGEIRVAYLERAGSCHPQRGGSHELMVLLSEAWHLLSDAKYRQRFDVARNSNDNHAISAAALDVKRAHQAAINYEADWTDFVRANFAFKDVLYLPQPDRRFGLLAIVCGGCIGTAFAVLAFVAIFSEFVDQDEVASMARLAILLPMFIGARLGWAAFLHWQPRRPLQYDQV